MSIISDALKKAEREKKKKTVETSVFGISLKESSKQKSVKKKRRLFLLLLVILLFILGLTKSKSINRLATQTLPQTNLKTVSKIETSEAPHSEHVLKQEKVKFVLSGILFDENESLAIINGRLVKKGDFVEEAEVIEINPKQVKLLYGNETIVLKMQW